MTRQASASPDGSTTNDVQVGRGWCLSFDFQYGDFPDGLVLEAHGGQADIPSRRAARPITEVRSFSGLYNYQKKGASR